MADANILYSRCKHKPSIVQTGARILIVVDVRNVQYVLDSGNGSALATSDGSMLRVKE